MSSFRRQLLSGVTYTAAAKYIGLLVSLLVTAVLSRILPPEDFGIVAIATIFINFFSLISTMGFSPAIIQNKDLNDTDIRHIFSFTIYLGVFSALLFVVISPFIAKIYQSEILTVILSILSLNILFSIWNIVPNALLFKKKEFKYIAVRTVWVQSLIGIVAIGGAYSGWGIYALLVNPVLGSLILLWISYRKNPVPIHLCFKMISIRKIFVFSAYQVLFNLAVLFYKNIDKILIGRFLNMAQLGYYEKSYRLMSLPLDNIGNVISPVMHPLLSEHQDDLGFIRDKYKRLVIFLAYIGFFLSVFLFFTAKESVLIVFGDRWLPSVDVFRILSFSIWALIIQSAVGPVFQSTNNTRGLFLSSLWACVLTLLGVGIGLWLGTIEWIAVGLVISHYLTLFFYNYYLYRQSLRSPLIDFVRILYKPFSITILFVAWVGLFSGFIDIENKYVSFVCKSLWSLPAVFLIYKFKLSKDFPVGSFKKNKYDK